MTRLIAACLGLMLTACAPTAVVRSTAPAAPVLPPEAGFVVVKEDEPFDGPAQELGDIHIKDGGLAVNCDYDAVLALAGNRARQLGANVLRVYEHRPPSIMGSSCHRIRAKALRVPDLTPYEKELVWHPQRRLRQADFKGSLDNRPFEASTQSGIRYHYAGNAFQGTVTLTVEAYFNCYESYFKGRRDPASTLAHEQVHFDITELYARRLAQAFAQQIGDTRELERKHEEIYRQISHEWQLRQDAYDTEAYADRRQVAVWQARVAQELQALQAYAGKQVTIKIRV